MTSPVFPKFNALTQKILNRSLDVLFMGPLFDPAWAARLNGKAICLCYHRVEDPASHSFLAESGVPAITAGALKADIHFLKERGFQFITFEELRKRGKLEPGRPHVILSFDDGYKDDYSNGLPVLREAGVRAVFFQTTSMVDAPQLMWEHALAWYCRDEEGRRRFTELARSVLPNEVHIAKKQGWELAHYLIEEFPYDRTKDILDAARKAFKADESRLTAEIYPSKSDLLSACEEGHEVASHGDAHYKRSNIDAGLFEKDLGISVEKIRSWTGWAPQTYAYPHGNTVEGDRAICAKYFHHAVTVRTGVIEAQSDPLNLPRFYWVGAPKNELRRKRWLLTGRC